MSVSVSGDTQARAMIETALFRRALTKFIANAIQHSCSGAHINIAIHELLKDFIFIRIFSFCVEIICFNPLCLNKLC